MVFQTAPPQPASKARITCSPQFVGGPEASQNGFGQRIPAKFVVRSALSSATRRLQDRQRSPFSVCHRVYHFPAAIYAVATGVIFRIGGAAGRSIDQDA